MIVINKITNITNHLKRLHFIDSSPSLQLIQINALAYKITHTEKNNYFDNFIFKLIHGYKAWGNLNKRNVLFISEPQDVISFGLTLYPQACQV